MFMVFHIIFTLAVCGANWNSKKDVGNGAVAFTSIWTCFLTILVVVIGAFRLFKQGTTSLAIGVVIGFSIMLTQLFFIAMFFMFIYGREAYISDNTTVAGANTAMGVMYLFLVIVFGVFSGLSFTYRNVLYSSDNKMVLNGGTASGNPMQGRQSDDFNEEAF